MIPSELIRLMTDRPFDSVADIGAANGGATIGYAAMFPEAQVYAFEPVISNLSYIYKVLAAQPDDIRDRIHVYDVALAARIGRADFYRSTGTPYADADSSVVDENGDWRLSSSLLPPKDHSVVHPWCGFRKETVDVTTFEAWALEHDVPGVDFIHMDVQGAELAVLKGAGPLIDTFKAVWMEVSTREMYEGQPLLDDVVAFMQARGFKLAHTLWKEDQPQGDQLWIAA